MMNMMNEGKKLIGMMIVVMMIITIFLNLVIAPLTPEQEQQLTKLETDLNNGNLQSLNDILKNKDTPDVLNTAIYDRLTNLKPPTLTNWETFNKILTDSMMDRIVKQKIATEFLEKYNNDKQVNYFLNKMFENKNGLDAVKYLFEDNFRMLPVLQFVLIRQLGINDNKDKVNQLTLENKRKLVEMFNSQEFLEKNFDGISIRDFFAKSLVGYDTDIGSVSPKFDINEPYKIDVDDKGNFGLYLSQNGKNTRVLDLKPKFDENLYQIVADNDGLKFIYHNGKVEPHTMNPVKFSNNLLEKLTSPISFRGGTFSFATQVKFYNAPTKDVYTHEFRPAFYDGVSGSLTIGIGNKGYPTIEGKDSGIVSSGGVMVYSYGDSKGFSISTLSGETPFVERGWARISLETTPEHLEESITLDLTNVKKSVGLIGLSDPRSMEMESTPLIKLQAPPEPTPNRIPPLLPPPEKPYTVITQPSKLIFRNVEDVGVVRTSNRYKEPITLILTDPPGTNQGSNWYNNKNIRYSSNIDGSVGYYIGSGNTQRDTTTSNNPTSTGTSGGTPSTTSSSTSSSATSSATTTTSPATAEPSTTEEPEIQTGGSDEARGKVRRIFGRRR